MLKKVQVLMSTFNGEKYIREQIESILKQDYDNIELLIRDDGSLDATVNIIKEYSNLYSNIRYYTGENCGPCKSFFDLVKNADKDSDYFAFSDQDDYWKPYKISKAIKQLERDDENQYLLYTCRPTIVNEKLEQIQSNQSTMIKEPCFKNALIENICIGCSMVFNQNLYKIIVDKIPENAYMHDWWMYLIASCFGKIIYDNESYLLYRQHNHNAIGMNYTFIKKWGTRYKNYANMKKYRELQVQELSHLYNIEGEKRKILDDLILSKNKLKPRINILIKKEVYRQKFIDDIIFKTLILFSGY